MVASRGDPFFDGAAVHVADVANLRVGQRQVAGDVIHAARVAADYGHNDLFVRAPGGAQRTGATER